MLLAIAGPNYECLFVDVGTNGRMNNSRIWNKSSLHRAIENREGGLPEPRALSYHLEKILFVILDDDAFALKNVMMKPFPQRNLTIKKRIYNYRHRRASRKTLGKHVWYPRKLLESISYNIAFESLTCYFCDTECIDFTQLFVEVSIKKYLLYPGLNRSRRQARQCYCW